MDNLNIGFWNLKIQFNSRLDVKRLEMKDEKAGMTAPARKRRGTAPLLTSAPSRSSSSTWWAASGRRRRPPHWSGRRGRCAARTRRRWLLQIRRARRGERRCAAKMRCRWPPQTRRAHRDEGCCAARMSNRRRSQTSHASMGGVLRPREPPIATANSTRALMEVVLHREDEPPAAAAKSASASAGRCCKIYR